MIAMMSRTAQPQWGRLSSSRITQPGRAGQHQVGAAMGPALIEPDHPVEAHGITSTYWPQWGRLSSSRITSPSARWSCWGRCRNGAGSHRAGSPGLGGGPQRHQRGPQWGRLSSSRITPSYTASTPTGTWPQWGRLSSSRITRPPVGGRTTEYQAAMGPALIEPDHPARPSPPTTGVSPQWGRLSSSRITWTRRPSSSSPTGRNGAGSHRAGSQYRHLLAEHLLAEHLLAEHLLAEHLLAEHLQVAAMGPALIEPDHSRPGGGP